MKVQNPYIHALIAELYIVCIVLVLFVGTSHFNVPETFLAPIALLSLLVLSVAIMAYLFFFVPLVYFLEGKRAEGIRFFLTTVVTFGGITVFVLGILYATALMVQS